MQYEAQVSSFDPVLLLTHGVGRQWSESAFDDRRWRIQTDGRQMRVGKKGDRKSDVRVESYRPSFTSP
jgi:hypothetical protein